MTPLRFRVDNLDCQIWAKSLAKTCSIAAIQFNVNPNKALPDAFARVAFRLQWNRWNGRKVAQLVIEESVAA